MTCQTCNGSRRIAKLVPNIKRSNGVDYHSSIPAPYVERLYQCDVCQGTGTEPEPPAAVVVNGGEIDAPGFTSETFTTSLQRAISRGFYAISPAGNGAVIVMTESGTPYRVNRHSCSCKGHEGHGYCQHRAAALACSDLWGINLCRDEVVGFDPTGRPMIAADELQEVA